MDNEQLKRSLISSALETNIRALDGLFGLPANGDFLRREFSCGGRAACVYFLQGMADGAAIDRFVIEPCQRAERCESLEEARLSIVGICECREGEYYGQAVAAALGGQTCLLIDGFPQALLLDTRGYEKRGVGRTQNESVVMGPQEGFVENLRTNVTLIRRILRTERLVSEEMEIGGASKTRVALLYIRGLAREDTVAALRGRLMGAAGAPCLGAGYLEQMIEEHPLSLFPQTLQTERPDRAASMLTEGQAALIVDGSPFALMAPVTLFHLLHSADDGYMRWQNGTFLRLVRMLGALLSLTLPALYLAVATHHSHVLPTDLLLSIAEARVKVPFSVLTEVLIMEISFFLINEAGARVPNLIGPTIGIVGALILGQAAVAAGIISPILIIIVALTGLGSYAVPYYPLSLTVSALRLALALAAAFFGLYGLVLALMALTARLCALTSFGVPYLSPFAPRLPHNDDLLTRGPIWTQFRHRFLARQGGGKAA